MNKRSFIIAKSSLLDLSSREKVLEVVFKNDRHLVYTFETKDAVEYTIDLEKLKPSTISKIYDIVNRHYLILCTRAS